MKSWLAPIRHGRVMALKKNGDKMATVQDGGRAHFRRISPSNESSDRRRLKSKIVEQSKGYRLVQVRHAPTLKQVWNLNLNWMGPPRGSCVLVSRLFVISQLLAVALAESVLLSKFIFGATDEPEFSQRFGAGPNLSASSTWPDKNSMKFIDFHYRLRSLSLFFPTAFKPPLQP